MFSTAGVANAAPTPAPSVSAGQIVKFYVVKRATDDGKPEFLFEIAEKTLGDGERGPEIFALTKGRLQPDGGRMTNPEVIRPGWVLILPQDAKGPDVQTGRMPGAKPAAPPEKPWRPTTPMLVAAGLGGFGLLIAIVAVVVARRAPRGEEDDASEDTFEAEPPRPGRVDLPDDVRVLRDGLEPEEEDGSRRRKKKDREEDAPDRAKRRRRHRAEEADDGDDDPGFASMAAALREESAGNGWGGTGDGRGLPGEPGLAYARPDGEYGRSPGGVGRTPRPGEGPASGGGPFGHASGAFGSGGPGDAPGGFGSAAGGHRPGNGFRDAGGHGPYASDVGGPAPEGPPHGMPVMPPEPPGVMPYQDTRPDITFRDVRPGQANGSPASAAQPYPVDPNGPMYHGPSAGQVFHQVAFGDDLVTLRLIRPGRSAATCWRPLPHDVPSGMAVVCVGAAPEGCLFLDLGVAPSTIGVEGPAESVERLAEAFVFQLASDTARASVAVVGEALEAVTDGPGIRRVSNLAALAVGQDPSDLVIAFLPADRDTSDGPLPQGPRVVQLRLGGSADAAWTLSVAPDRGAQAWQSDDVRQAMP